MKVGISQIKQETPKWATWMFRVTFILTTAFCTYVEASSLFDDQTQHEILIVLKLLVDPIVYGLSKMFGVDVKEGESFNISEKKDDGE